ncbi:1534_t:CDS:2, partial [Racocetra persica]
CTKTSDMPNYYGLSGLCGLLLLRVLERLTFWEGRDNDNLCTLGGRNASNLYHEIISQKLDGFENLTMEQVYVWWAKESAVFYQCHDDQYKSAKLLSNENNFKIVFI